MIKGICAKLFGQKVRGINKTRPFTLIGVNGREGMMGGDGISAVAA